MNARRRAFDATAQRAYEDAGRLAGQGGGSTAAPSPDYWRRTLARFIGGTGQVVVTFRDPAGRTRTWCGRLLRLDDARGPIVEYDGAPARLCGWGQLRSVEELR